MNDAGPIANPAFNRGRWPGSGAFFGGSVPHGWTETTQTVGLGGKGSTAPSLNPGRVPGAYDNDEPGGRDTAPSTANGNIGAAAFRVLIADDEPEVRELLREFMGDQG